MNSTFFDPSLLSATATSSVSPTYHQKAAGKPLRKAAGVCGYFELVSETELEEEFDLLDNEGPSADNGTIKEDSSLSVGWEDVE
jgi:hypothetical protein